MVFSDVIETCTPFLKDIAFLNFEILFKHGETKKNFSSQSLKGSHNGVQ